VRRRRRGLRERFRIGGVILSAVQDVLEEPELPKSIRSRNEPVKNNPHNVVICVLDTGDFVVLS
jgi:hypothetical protein